MSQQSLIEKIKADAQQQAEAIIAEGEAKAAAIKQEADKELAALTEQFNTALEKEKAHLETVALSQARQEANIALQRAKREGVNNVFDALFAELKDASAAEYVKFFTKVAKDVLPEKAKGTAHAPANRLDETKDILKAVHASTEVVESKKTAAGFLFDTEDGVYDVTLERIFHEVRPKLEVELINQVA